MQTLAPCLLAVAHEAVENWDHPDQPHIKPLLTGELHAVWMCPELSYLKGTDNRSTTSLLLALARQAGRYTAEGLNISARDCYWLMAKLRGGSLLVLSSTINN